MAGGQIPSVSTPYYDIQSLENVHFAFQKPGGLSSKCAQIRNVNLSPDGSFHVLVDLPLNENLRFEPESLEKH